ncbi:MAG: prenyltransferase/squalene oxidase repeat-containing protein, partial [Lentisphaeria bacterium]|nr:prenyltransferase/squalene oxidase repeat-containing protein [Lentisphaeria bacterium]
LPQRLLSILNVQVVSYAIPALIAVGLAQHEACQGGLTWQLRRWLIAPTLRVLAAKQPASGGFLEAAPLTAFCLLCLCAAGRGGHPVAAAAEGFLAGTCRDDGSWPIDSNLDQWVTALATRALAGVLPATERQALAEIIRRRQFADVHPFTAARPGGWGWTPLSGAVPDADDSAAALIALHELAGAGGGPLAPEVVRGCEWLLALQNRDGGIPTFCRGWGKLPFDRSCPDLSAHAYRALSCWQDALPVALRRRVARSRGRLLAYLSAQQRADGSFVPLWFGDQQADDLLAPVYGTAVVLEHLAGLDSAMMTRARDYLLRTQGADGGWGTAQGTHAKLIFTARALTALAGCPGGDAALCRGVAYLRPYLQERQPLPVEPVGLYFSQLWYSEELYPLVFLVRALEQLHAQACRRDL